jgi:actin-related protein 3
MSDKPACVIDNGTGFTKMGYSGNMEPNFIVPSLISTIAEGKSDKKKDIEDLNFFIGAEANNQRLNYNIDAPIRHGIVENWDNMEKYWQRCIYQYLKADPEEHYMLLTEPPLNTPENREYTAEIMFETFNVPALYIGVQAVLALCASIFAPKKKSKKEKKSGNASHGANKEITGCVVDSGDGATHIIPVDHGYVIGSRISHVPLAGSDVTAFILNLLRERGEPVEADQAISIARTIKEQWCYVAPDIKAEFNSYDANPTTKFRCYEGKTMKSKRDFKIDVGYERFLGPEIFFSPEIFSNQHTTPLPTLVDNVILNCPVDCRRPLFNYIALSGGTTMFSNFARRLQRDVKRRVRGREKMQFEQTGFQARQIDVNVIEHNFQRFAVWFGGSIMCIQPSFKASFHTAAQYAEVGPSIARHNAAFQSVT